MAGLLRRVVALRRSRAEPARTELESSPEERIEQLERRIERLEANLEGLQDAVHREAVRERQRLAELEKKAQPSAIARSLSDDARRRGL